MTIEKKCRLCKYYISKRKFFGRRRFVCTLRRCEVRGSDVCTKFVRDGDRALLIAGFRSQAGPDSCHTCTYCESFQGEAGRTYVCKRNDVRFGPWFSTMGYICDNFKDGGMEVLISRLAELVVDQNKTK